MPNFHAKTINPPAYPFGEAGVDFLWEAHSQRGERLVMVRHHDKHFLLQIHDKKESGFLIKGDKSTRPTEALILQEALMAFQARACDAVSCSNIEPGRQLHVKQSPYLKTIDFFMHDFNPQGEVWLEIGFGSGRHLLHQAKKHPHIQFIGIEIHKPSLHQLLKQCALQGIENIFVLDYDARLLMELLPSNSVGLSLIHI